MRKQLFYWVCLCGMLSACADDDYTTPFEEEGNTLSLVASKLYLITRSGDKIVSFREGSDYVLYAVRTPGESGYAWESAKMYGLRGTESDGVIDYGAGKKSFSRGVNLDFYAVALDKAGATGYTIPDDVYDTAATAAPTIRWGEGIGTPEAQQVGDLMLSQVKCVSSDVEIVTMPFKHAMTQFTFTVAKQDESDKPSDLWLDSVRLTKITLSGLHSQGTLALTDSTGVWSFADDAPTVERTIYSAGDSAGILLTTKSQIVPDSLLVIPNWTRLASNSLMVYPLTLHVTFLFKTTPKTAAGESENTTVTPQEDGSYLVTVDYPLTTGNLSGVTAKDENGEETLSADPMKFSANYRYNFAIYLTRGNIRILAIAPTVYDWVYEEVEADDAIVGQPVTLGGLMWMDRNLGASTWDAENDFYGSIGYYYQFGRNIPFILDSAQFIYFTHDDDIKSFDWKDSRGPCIGRATDTTTTEWYNPYHAWTSIHKITPTMQEQDSLRKCQVRCFYTYDYFGDTVCNHFFSAGSNAFRFPGQVTYKSKSTEIDTVATHRNYRFAVNKGSTSQSQTWTSANSSARDYWKDLDNQPCPKGWRLPTHQDLYSFMPWGGRVVWYSYGNIYMTATSTKASPSTHYWNYGPEVTKNKSNSYTDEYNATWTEGTLGWYRRDVGDADTGDFEGSIQEIRFGQKGSKAAGYYHVIYMLKWAGTDKAYRIRIMSKFAKGHINRDQYSTNKRYISISRYAAEKDKTLDDYVQNGNDETMWDNPIETLLYPCAGFLVTDANASDLRSFGTGLVARTSEANPTETSSSWVQYLTTATFNVNVENSSRRSLGDQVRCCRDISASY